MSLVADLITAPAGRLGAAAQNALEVARFGGLETDEEPSPVRGRRRAAGLPAAPLLPADAGRRHARAPAAAARAAADARRRGLRRLAARPARSTRPARPRRRPVGRRLRRARARGGRPRAHPRRPRASRSATRSTASARRPAATSTSPATRRAGCSATRPPRYRRGEGIDSRRSPSAARSTPAARCRFGLPEEVARRAAAGVLAERVFGRAGVPGLDEPHRLPAARPGRSRCASGSTSSASSTTARRCCRASASAASSRARAGSPGPGPALADFIAPVHRPQPDAPGRLRDRGPARDARRHRPARSCPSSARSTRSRRRRRCGRSRRAAPRAEVYEVALPAGHFGLVVGSTATTHDLAGGRRLGRAGGPARASCPADVRRGGRGRARAPDARASAPGSGYGLELAAGVGAGLARSVAGAAVGATADGVRGLGEEAPASCRGSAGSAGSSPRHPDLARAAARRAGAGGAPDDVVLPVRGPRLHARRGQARASTTSSAACSRSASARASTSAC